MLAIQLEKNRTELEYLDSVLQMITLSEGDRDLQEIRQELMDNGYLRQHKRKMTAKGKVKIIHAKPMEFRSSAGLTILVGKNNSQNDRLTLKDSDKRDLWFHVQKLHGSHVILKTGGVQPDDQSVTEAARGPARRPVGDGSGRVGRLVFPGQGLGPGAGGCDPGEGGQKAHRGQARLCHL